MIESKERIIKVCKHESGHYIVSRELKFRTNGLRVKIFRYQGHLASAVIEPWTPNIDSLEKIADYLERRIKVLYAGVLSEAIINDNYESEYALNQWRKGGGKDDYAKIRELVQTLRNIYYPDTKDVEKIQGELNNIDIDLLESAHEIVMKRQELIKEISEIMYNKIKEFDIVYVLTDDEINKIQKIKELYANT